ncbi:MAG: response regulator, partial [Gammaproteobacteria bacterium]|nr:response regulator [Gammaproteobacteria bacterium]
MSDSRIDVLLVDDSVTDLRLLIDLMSLRDLRLSVAQDGARGYQLAVALQPGLILLDVNLPKMDGYAVCRRLKSNPLTVGIPVIFLTAETDLDERLKGFAAGGVDYISKPFEAQEVLARVGVHLELAVRRARIIDASLGTSLDAVLVASAQKILRDRMANPPSLEELAHQVGSNRRRLNEA